MKPKYLISKGLILSAGMAAALSFSVAVFAQTPPLPGSCEEAQVVKDKALLEMLKVQCEAEIEAQTKLLKEKQKESVSLERDVSILNTQIKKAQLSIKSRDLAISNISDDIGEKEVRIETYEEKIERERESMSQLLRKTDEVDQASFLEVLLTRKNISEFFLDLDAFASIKFALRGSLFAIAEAKVATEGEKASLEEKQSEEVDLRKIQLLEKNRIEQNEAEKKSILKVTKGQEAAYQKLIKEKEKKAAAIRAALFDLSGAKAIPFGTALEYANIVSQKTGVRPALILGIIELESELGENVGTGTWRADMHPTRDVPVFQQITTSLGLDPDKMPVSARPCSKAERERVGPGKPCGYGYGGAMGPAQFIPSTWVLYTDNLQTMLGHTPNPWEPFDAFMASALLLRDNGAAKRTAQAEWKAAMCYLAGCRASYPSSLHFYGDNVMSLAAAHQKNIDLLQGN